MKKAPQATIILLAVLMIVMVATWFLPSITFDMVKDENLGYEVIDKDSIQISQGNKILPWQLPAVVVEGIKNVFSIILLICACNGAFAVLTASGMFDIMIRNLCRKFRHRESALIILVFTCFSLLGLTVVPHCFIAFVPTVIALAVNLGYDPIVGLAMVLFGATTASMTGPLSAVTAMCQERVGLPLYSGMTVRFILFAVFHIINALYLSSYAKKVQKDPSKSYIRGFDPSQYQMLQETQSEEKLSVRHVLALLALAATFAVIIIGSTSYGFGTDDISGVFLTYALVAGIILHFPLADIFRHFVTGMQASTMTSVVMALAGAITVTLKQAGIFSTLLYATSVLYSKLPGFLVPAGLLVAVSVMNCILPSGPAKAVALMPLLGPVGQMSGVTMQTSVLSYTLGDSFSNYLLPYDSTTASYLAAGKIRYSEWAKFVTKLFFIWNLVGILALTILYYTGYGPF